MDSLSSSSGNVGFTPQISKDQSTGKTTPQEKTTEKTKEYLNNNTNLLPTKITEPKYQKLLKRRLPNLPKTNTNTKTDEIFKRSLSIDSKEKGEVKVEESESEEEYIQLRRPNTQKGGTVVEAKVGEVAKKELSKNGKTRLNKLKIKFARFHKGAIERKMKKGGEVTLVNAGADKWVVKLADVKGKVAYFAKSVFRKKTLFKEVKQARDLMSEFEGDKGRTVDQKEIHLALGYEDITADGKVVGFQVEEALCDAKTFLSSDVYKNEVTSEIRQDLAEQFLEGMKNLNDKGFAHCDLKLDNLLIFKDNDGDYKLLISDFGKARKIPPEGSNKTIHGSGNNRMHIYFEKVSKQSDGPAAAMVIMEILGHKAENFVVDNKNFQALIQKTPKAKMERLKREFQLRLGTKKYNKGTQNNEIRDFINGQENLSDKHKEILNGLTASNPDTRWDFETALEEYQK